MKPAHSLIIGGTRGIGRELVEHFARQGHKVSVIARQSPKRKAKGAVSYWTADIRNAQTLMATLKQLIKVDGKINHLVFFQRYRGDGDAWSGEIETSLTATKTIVEAVQDKFAAGDKAIVIVSSINAALIADAMPISYHMAKAALLQMVRYWAVALGPRGVRVNSVSPGTVLKQESKRFFLRDKELAALYRRITPLRRFGLANEVASVVDCLCGSQMSFVTGQDIVVDGGVSLLWQEALARELVGLDRPPAHKPAKHR